MYPSSYENDVERWLPNANQNHPQMFDTSAPLDALRYLKFLKAFVIRFVKNAGTKTNKNCWCGLCSELGGTVVYDPFAQATTSPNGTGDHPSCSITIGECHVTNHSDARARADHDDHQLQAWPPHSYLSHLMQPTMFPHLLHQVLFPS